MPEDTRIAVFFISVIFRCTRCRPAADKDSSSVFSETHRFGRAGVGGASEAPQVFFERLGNQEEYCFGLLIYDRLEIDYNFKISEGKLRRGGRITSEKEEKIIAALTKDPHASRVAGRVGVSFSTVWRRAERAGIALTAGRETMGRRFPPERETKIIEAMQANPNATQEAVARIAGVSRSTIGRRKRGDPRRRDPSPVL
jgi:transcriptional regulator of acetoin/glycerol metabolism